MTFGRGFRWGTLWLASPILLLAFSLAQEFTRGLDSAERGALGFEKVYEASTPRGFVPQRIQINHDGSLLYLASEENNAPVVEVWNWRSKELVRTVSLEHLPCSAQDKHVQGIGLVLNDQYMGVTYCNRTYMIKLATNELAFTSPDGELWMAVDDAAEKVALCVAGTDRISREIQVYDARNWELRRHFAADCDGPLDFVANGTLLVYPHALPDYVLGYDERATFSRSPRTTTAPTVTNHPCELLFIEIATGRTTHSLSLQPYSANMCAMPSFYRILPRTGHVLVSEPFQSHRVIDWKTGRVLFTIQPNEIRGAYPVLGVSPDGQWIAVRSWLDPLHHPSQATSNHEYQIWDMVSGKLLYVSPVVVGSPAQEIMFSGDRRYALEVRVDSIRLFEITQVH